MGRPETWTTVAGSATLSALTFGWDDDGVLSSISGLQTGTLGYLRSAWSYSAYHMVRQAPRSMRSMAKQFSMKA